MGVGAREQLRDKIAIQHPTARHITDLNFLTLWQEPTIPGLFTSTSMFLAPGN